ncbi:tripartite tricarboxylate transporter substrate binding protein [Alcaligenaceae bacterium]|nr:tripartite tricarboxylate transporter substrate binding protein [Alcaligenaceae bacterium]
MKKAISSGIVACTLTLAVGAAPGVAQADFPDKPIEIIVPTPPGGGTDTVIRQLADLVEGELGQKVVVANRPGGGGYIGMMAVIRARPDGYTLGGLWNAPLTMTPHVQPAPYSPQDYVAISLADSAPIVLCTKQDFPAGNGNEFIEHLQKNPNKYTYGTDGVGGTIQLAAERIFMKKDVKAKAVPFGGAGETLKNFLGNHVDIYGGSISTIVPYVNDGTAKCLLLTGNTPNASLPDAATVTDVGVPEAVTTLWHGIIAPKGLPEDRLAILEDAFRKAARSEQFTKYMESRGLNVEASTAQEFRTLIDTEYEAMGEVTAALGLAKK